MRNWGRFIYQPVLPMGKDGTENHRIKRAYRLVRGRRHAEGMVLLKNEARCTSGSGWKKGQRCSAKASTDYVKGGGGSGDVTVDYVRSLQEGMKVRRKQKERYAVYAASGGPFMRR